LVEIADARLHPPSAPAARPEFSIVPLWGIPIVLVVLGGLVVAIATNSLWALDFYHVVGGGMWTAIDLFVGFVVGPIIGKMSIPARIEFSTRFMPKMLLLMPTLVTMTLASGWQLARIVVGVMAVIAIGILEPANLTVLFELKKPQPDGALIARQMQRFIYTAGFTGALQVATLVIMTYLAAG
jgi:hypothetical protein